ncbi:MAG TPA: histidinol dehydrogenase [Candidatus Coproplasma avicola]|uniref:Histidinol dehydrogenase n=1 Tax=Candidatus Coproplasma avicola TaxID=2840744 RepID=A0A9D1E7F2_9FIRM|nr:histidinol dehydrogenase [Candidatus Coproplasma avicola]
MIKPVRYSENNKNDILKRTSGSTADYEEGVKKIISDVRSRGDEALKEYTIKFDGVKLDDLRVSPQEFDEAEGIVGSDYKAMLQRATENIATFHRAQLRQGFEIKGNGFILGQKVTPLESAGLYVPGGKAAYPSTVLMNAVPAKIAGVNRIVMVTPPLQNGKIKPEVLVAAKIAGVSEVYKVGGAQAIAALAYGTESIKKVNKITGPGNIYVAAAKKLVYGDCGIDMIAGPSEILIIADGDADAENVAADLLSQAEHDELATAVLITNSMDLAQNVCAALENRLKNLARRAIAQASIKNNCKVIVTDDLERAVQLSDELAPEHLELAVKEPFELLKKVRNAGSVFLGYNTPEPVGDYYAGPNHTLPTGGTAKFSSPLGVEDFIKTTQYIYYTREKLRESADDIVMFANSEGLTAHAQSVSVRIEK